MSRTQLINPLLQTIRAHKSGESVGVFSVCSAHPTVVQAAIEQAASQQTTAGDGYVLIEATSNQVDRLPRAGLRHRRPVRVRP
jgi:D-tagatose-1,6-bisphosphate aldolase subunit GatZ/KbaZ